MKYYREKYTFVVLFSLSQRSGVIKFSKSYRSIFGET